MTPPSGAARYHGETFVLKLGGESVEETAAIDELLVDLLALQAAGIRIVLVHGGGPQATALTKDLGLAPRVVGGRRITDGRTLEVMKMTLAGQVSVDLLSRCRACGLPAVGASGVAADLIQAVRRPPRVVSGCGDEPVDFGHVGDIEAIGIGLVEHLLDGGYLPVINSLGSDGDGQVLNINADIAATRIAMALGARKLFLLTGAPGVLRDANDPASLISTLTVEQARKAISDGTIGGGMIPKLEESFVALEAGVAEVHILGANTSRGLLMELTDDRRTGTLLHA